MYFGGPEEVGLCATLGVVATSAEKTNAPTRGAFVFATGLPPSAARPALSACWLTREYDEQLRLVPPTYRVLL